MNPTQFGMLIFAVTILTGVLAAFFGIWWLRRQELRDLVFYNLDEIGVGDYYHGQTDWQIAADLSRYAIDFAGVPPGRLQSHVRAWMTERAT